MRKIFFGVLMLFMVFPNQIFALYQTNSSATVVVGQADFTHRSINQGGSVAGNTLYNPLGIISCNEKFIIADRFNNRVLIYNTIPNTNGAFADVVIGQVDFEHNSANQGGSVANNTLNRPIGVFCVNSKLFISDGNNNRVLIYNTIPNTNGAFADVVIGQVDFEHNSANQGGSISASTLSTPTGLFSDGFKLYISDYANNRILIYNTIPNTNGASADVVIGQADFSSGAINRGGSVDANTLYWPYGIYSDGTRLFIGDNNNQRVLIYNTIPITNDVSADVVIGQEDFTHNSTNQGGSVRANTLSNPLFIYSDGVRLFVADYYNSRILVYNSIPTSNNVSADVVIGQPDFISNGDNQGGIVGANTLYDSRAVYYDGIRLYISDYTNHRILIYPLGPTTTEATIPRNTISNEVTINLNASGDAKEYTISENPNFTGSSWQSYAPTVNWTLSEPKGDKNVYVKFRDYINFESNPITLTTKYIGAGGGGHPALFNPPPTTINTPVTITETPKTISYNLGTSILKKGSTGETVKELQRFLNTTLNLNLTLDGKLGPKTITSIKQFQKANNLTPDGIVGPKTRKVMEKGV